MTRNGIEGFVSALHQWYEGELAATKSRRASVASEHEQFYAGKQVGLEDALYWLYYFAKEEGIEYAEAAQAEREAFEQGAREDAAAWESKL